MNNAECVQLIEIIFGKTLLNDGFIKQDKMIWIKWLDKVGDCFESYQVHLGKFGYNFSYGFGNKNLPFCSGVRDLCDQKAGKYVANLKIDFSKRGSKNNDLLINWYPGAGMAIDEKCIAQVVDVIFKYSHGYRSNVMDITDIINVFHLEKSKWHLGLPFYSVVNNLIMEYIFTFGGNKEIENQLSEIYGGGKRKIKALKSIQYLKSAQQGDAPECRT